MFSLWSIDNPKKQVLLCGFLNTSASKSPLLCCCSSRNLSPNQTDRKITMIIFYLQIRAKSFMHASPDALFNSGHFLKLHKTQKCLHKRLMLFHKKKDLLSCSSFLETSALLFLFTSSHRRINLLQMLPSKTCLVSGNLQVFPKCSKWNVTQVCLCKFIQILKSL